MPRWCQYLERSLAQPHTYIAKLAWMAHELVARPEKAVVLLRARTGYKYFTKLLEKLRVEAGATFRDSGCEVSRNTLGSLKTRSDS